MPFTYMTPGGADDQPWRKRNTNPYLPDDGMVTPDIGEVEAPPSRAPQAQPSKPAPVAPSVSDSASSATADADRDLAAYRAAVADRPTMQYKKGALGVLQRVGDVFLNPAITHPEYTQQMGQYQQRAKALGEVASISEAQAKNARGQAEAQARISASEKQGKYYDRQMDKLDQPKPEEWEYNAHINKWVKKGTTETKDAPPQVQKPANEKSPTGEAFIYDRMQRLEELKAKGVRSPEEQVEMNSIQQFLQKREAEERAKLAIADRAARGPAQPGDAPQNAFRMIEQKKQDALLKLEGELTKQLDEIAADANPMGKAERKAQALARHEQMKAQVQQAYLHEIDAAKRSGGGTPGPVTGPGQPAQPKAAAPAAPPSKPGGNVPRRPVSLINPKTGETRQFNLTDEELQDAKRQGYQPVG